MNDMLTKEEVLHVAHLARIEISEDEIKPYCGSSFRWEKTKLSNCLTDLIKFVLPAPFFPIKMVASEPNSTEKSL